MVFGKLFKSKKSKGDEPGKTEETSEVAKDPLPSLEPTESPRISKTNAVFPFHDVKATSFPPPLSIDASVYTEAQKTTPEEPKNSIEPPPISKNANNARGDTHTNEKKEIEPCDRKTCPKDSHCLDSCEKLSKKQHETKDKMSNDRLTEMINVSIKEAIETITKQCRMVPKKQVSKILQSGSDPSDDAEKYPEKKPKEEIAKSVCHSRESSWKTKRERPRSAEEYFRKCSQKRSRPREKRKRARTCPRKREEIAKCHCKKVVPCEGTRTKKHAKSSPGKTDNRRMTGNVNIYICSEATENAQPVNKQKKPPPCAESSSETTTEPSNVSSCKLATRIRNKRRKHKEQQSAFLRSSEESSDPSDPCSCDSKFSDVAAESESTVCAQDTESTSTDCRCKDDQVQSDQSIGSTFVICDKIEDRCSSKMSSISDSEEWSSKSCSGAETVLCDQGRRDFDQTASAESKYGDYCTRSLKRDQDSGREVDRAYKKDACKCQGGFRGKKRISKTREPWSTCSCIAEEDEGDVCVTEKESLKLTVCQKSVDSDLRGDSEDKKRTVNGEGGHVDEQIEGKQEDDLDRDPSPLTSRKLIRPEALTLKELIQQARRPAVDQKTTIPPSEGKDAIPVEQARGKQQPAFLRKFNLRDKDRFLKHLKDFQDTDEAEQNRKSGGGEETEGKKTEEEKEDEEDAEGEKGFPERLRNSWIKTLKRVSVREKDKIAEKNSDNRTEASEKITDGDQSVKAEKTQKGKRMSLAERLDINKFFRKKDKSADNKKPATKKKGKRSAETNSEIKPNTNEGTEKKEDEEKKEADVGPEKLDKKLPLSADVASENPVLKSRNIEETKETVPEDLPAPLAVHDAVKISPRDIREESKDRKNPEDQEEKLPDAKSPNVEECRKIEEIREEKKPEVCPSLKKVSVTICTRRPHEKPLMKELRQPASRCVPREPEVRTVCTNQQFPACTNVDRSNERIEDSRCNCCCMPAPQSCSRLSNYPKSCLKKERPFCRMESQENNCAVLYRDNRSWEECGCRRIVLCERCCSPRNECSCRPVPPCVTCYKPKTECICNTICPPRSTSRRLKSMVCLYCDNPRESCTCRAPIRKCSCCDLAVDLCCCEENLKSFQGGRSVASEPECDRTIYVTAWKPREDVRRYFSRNLDELRRDSMNECCCHEKPKSQNSDDLPYQRLSCFSDVMNELQRKISESVCCTLCRKIPCCCNLKVDEGRDEKKIKYCVSPKSRRKVVAVCTDKPRSKSPTICKCDPQSRTERSKKIVICCICKSSPCRCKKPKSKKPRLKCYYCKNSPCVCITARERSSKPRPCRCADSPCRGKEKDITVCGKTSAKPKNNEEKIICVR